MPARRLTLSRDQLRFTLPLLPSWHTAPLIGYPLNAHRRLKEHRTARSHATSRRTVVGRPARQLAVGLGARSRASGGHAAPYRLDRLLSPAGARLLPADSPEEDGAGQHLHCEPEVCIGSELSAPL